MLFPRRFIRNAICPFPPKHLRLNAFPLFCYLREQPARVGDVDCGLLLVAGEDPDDDAGAPQLGDGLGHAVLQLVLDPRRPQQLQPPLHRVVRLGQQALAVVQGVLGRRVVLQQGWDCSNI